MQIKCKCKCIIKPGIETQFIRGNKLIKLIKYKCPECNEVYYREEEKGELF